MTAVLERAQLRPLGVGDIVDRVFTIYRTKPILLLTVSAIPYLLLVLMVGILGLFFAGSIIALAPVFGGEIEDFAVIAPLLAQLGLFVIIVVAVALVVSLIQSAALVEATAAQYLGRQTSVGRSLGVGLRATPRLFVMGLVALVAFLVLWAVLIVAMVALREWYVLLAAILAGSVASVYIAASWMVSPAVATLEGIGPVHSLTRSWWLSGGNRWRIIGLILLLSILQVVLGVLLGGLLVVAIAAEPGVRFAVQQALNLLITIAWAPIYWGTFAILYYDLRVRKEAYDLELAAGALPRET